MRRRSIGLDYAPASMFSEMHQPGNITVALALAEGGLSIFPASGSVVPTGEVPGKISKAPLVSAWREKSTTDLDQIRRWWRKWPGALPAIDCGKSGLLVVDPDRRSGADGLSAWRDLVRKEGGLPVGVLTVETANGGRHVYFRADMPRGNSAGSLPSGIDVRSDGGYVIGPGATVEDGRRWNAQDGLSAFIAVCERGRLPTPPDWLKKRLAGKREERTNASFNVPTFPSLSELRKAVGAIPNDEEFDSREEWRNVVAAVKHEALLHGEEDEGFILARKWSAEWDNSDAADAHFCETWDSLKRGNAPNARTGKSLLRLASRHGYRLPSPDHEFEDERQREVVGKVVERRKEKSFRSQMQIVDIEAAASLALTKSRKPLIDGLFDEGAMSVAYGPSNVGKTFVVLDLACAVATGLPWNGMATTRGLVVYVAAEGGFGVNQRLLALLQRHERKRTTTQ